MIVENEKQMNFRTTFDIPPDPTGLTYQMPVMMLGSCFSDNIGKKLTAHKFNVHSNPYGVIYNPYSIQQVLKHMLGDYQLNDTNFVFHNEQWHSYLHHGSFSETKKEALTQKIAETRNTGAQWLQKTRFLFITFGTAWVYQLKKTRQIVANCHKVPAAEFHRFRLSTCDITDEFSLLIQRLESINPDLKIVFTLSPVRHMKDGAMENQLSKSILNVAIHDLVAQYEQCSYFPSYELVMDDLRDYRFYAPDMTHLTEQAVAYIYKRFLDTYVDEVTLKMTQQVEKLKQGLAHRPVNPGSDAHQQLLHKIRTRIEALQKQVPQQDWREELETINQLLG
jgi:hypothetical protein